MTSAQAHQTPTKTRNVAIPVSLHRRLKSMAAMRGTSLQNLVEQSILKGLELVPSGCALSQQNGISPNPVPVDREE